MLTRQAEAAQNVSKEITMIPVNKSFNTGDVMREQREIIYAQRYDVITADRDLAPEIHFHDQRTIIAVDGHVRWNKMKKTWSNF